MLFFVLLDVTRTLVKEMKMAISADIQSKVSWIITFKPCYPPSPNIIHTGANAEAASVTKRQLKEATSSNHGLQYVSLSTSS